MRAVLLLLLQRAEAYRQLALLKQELLAEKHKNGEREIDGGRRAMGRARGQKKKTRVSFTRGHGGPHLCLPAHPRALPLLWLSAPLVVVGFLLRPALLSKELYGLKEEFELRDFADQLRAQSAQVGRGGYGISGATARLNLAPAAVPSAAPAAAAAAVAAAMGSTVGAGALPSSTPSKPAYTVGGSALRGVSRTTSPTSYEEKEHAVSAALVRDLRVDSSSLLLHGPGLAAAAGAGARDLTADLAAVRALQEQDRRLTNTYARVNSRG